MTVFDACLDSKHWKNLRIIVGGHTHTRIHLLGCTPPTTKQKIPGVSRLVLPGWFVGSSRLVLPGWFVGSSGLVLPGWFVGSSGLVLPGWFVGSRLVLPGWFLQGWFFQGRITLSDYIRLSAF